MDWRAYSYAHIGPESSWEWHERWVRYQLHFEDSTLRLVSIIKYGTARSLTLIFSSSVLAPGDSLINFQTSLKLRSWTKQWHPQNGVSTLDRRSIYSKNACLCDQQVGVIWYEEAQYFIITTLLISKLRSAISTSFFVQSTCKYYLPQL
jgi:hypothetical protein